jgi:hypothetical protein
VDAKKDNAGLLQGRLTLNRQLPEVLVEGNQDGALVFGTFQERGIVHARAAGTDPNDVVAVAARGFHP